MEKLITKVTCRYIGDVEGNDVIKELESGGFSVFGVGHPYYQATNELEIKSKLKEAFIALVEMKHEETLQDLSETVRETLKTGSFELVSSEFKIKYPGVVE